MSAARSWNPRLCEANRGKRGGYSRYRRKRLYKIGAPADVAMVQSMYPSITPPMRKPRRALRGLADRLGSLSPLSITSASSQASCLQCCSAVAGCSGSRGGRRHDRGRHITVTGVQTVWRCVKGLSVYNGSAWGAGGSKQGGGLAVSAKSTDGTVWNAR